jgi:hypothetical protein
MPQLDFISLFPIVLGLLLLFLGRKVFWLFVGAVAFIVVMTIVPQYIKHYESTVFYVALGVGILAAGAGWFFQKIALRLAGFLAGGYVFFSLWEKYASTDVLPWWLPFVLGGILGAVLLSFLFEWALIILSSATGAFLVSQQFHLETNFSIGLMAVLALVGIVVQSKMKRGKTKARDD